MGIAKSGFGGRKTVTAAITISALLLAGCGGGIGGGSDVGPLGSGNADGQGNFGSSMQTATVAPAVAQPDDSSFTCPKVDVRGGAAAWQVNDKTDGALRYQATLGRFSRECRFTSPDMTMRIGIQGRVLMGPKGTAGLLNVPIRVAVVEEGPNPKPIWTKLYMVPVQIGAEVMQVDFSMVAEEPSFPRPDPAVLERYVVYVGFDSQAPEVAESKPKPRTARPRPVAAAPKPAAPRPAAQAGTPRRPTQSANNEPPQAPRQAAPAQAAPAPAHNTSTQWIGTPAPSSSGFMTPTQ